MWLPWNAASALAGSLHEFEATFSRPFHHNTGSDAVLFLMDEARGLAQALWAVQREPEKWSVPVEVEVKVREVLERAFGEANFIVMADQIRQAMLAVFGTEAGTYKVAANEAWETWIEADTCVEALTKLTAAMRGPFGPGAKRFESSHFEIRFLHDDEWVAVARRLIGWEMGFELLHRYGAWQVEQDKATK